MANQLTLTGIVQSKSIPQAMPGMPGQETPTQATINLNVNGTTVTIQVPVAQEVNYLLGSTINFTQQ